MSKMRLKKKKSCPTALNFWLKIKDLKVFDTTSGLKSWMKFNIKHDRTKMPRASLEVFCFLKGILKHTRLSWVNGEILVPWAVLILTIGDVFGMWSKNHAKMRWSYAKMAQNIAKTCKNRETLFDKLQKFGVRAGVYYTIYPSPEMSIFAPSPLRKRIFAGIFADPQKFCKNFCAGSISIIFRILGGAGFYGFKCWKSDVLRYA